MTDSYYQRLVSHPSDIDVAAHFFKPKKEFQMTKSFKMSTLVIAMLAMMHGAAHADWGSNDGEPYNRSGDSFAKGEALKAGEVADGVIVAVRPVMLEASQTAVTTGTLAGGGLGALGGSKFGKGKGKIVTGVLGGIVGAGVGQAMGEAVSERHAGELVVQLEQGRKIFIVQEDGMRFQPGDKVFVLKSQASGWGGNANYRVSPAFSGGF